MQLELEKVFAEITEAERLVDAGLAEQASVHLQAASHELQAVLIQTIGAELNKRIRDKSPAVA